MSAATASVHRPHRLLRLLTLAGLVVAVLAFVTWRVVSAPGEPPRYNGERPAEADGGYASVTHSVLIAATPQQVWEWSNAPDNSLEDLVQFDNGFPAVVSTEPLHGDWIPGQRVGDRRRVTFADGHHLAEEVIRDEPDRFRYMIWGFTSPQRFAVQHGVAEFTYTPDRGGTRVSWTYTLLPTLGAARPIVESFLDSTMTPMMRATLTGMRDEVEASLP